MCLELEHIDLDWARWTLSDLVQNLTCISPNHVALYSLSSAITYVSSTTLTTESLFEYDHSTLPGTPLSAILWTSFATSSPVVQILSYIQSPSPFVGVRWATHMAYGVALIWIGGIAHPSSLSTCETIAIDPWIATKCFSFEIEDRRWWSLSVVHHIHL